MSVETPSRITSLIVAAGLLALVLVRFVAGADNQRPLSADEREYLVAAGNLLRFGVYSDLPMTAGPAPPPTARRPPAYPLFIATVLALPGGHATRIPEDLESPDARDGLGTLRWAQALLLGLTAWMTSVIALRLTAGHRWSFVAACAAGGAVALDGVLIDSAHRFLSESLALPLLVGLCWSLMAATARPTRLSHGVAGLTLAALVLTRPLLFYAAPVLLIILAWSGLRRGATRRRVATDAAVFLLAFALPVLGWMGRNLIRLDRLFIAEGAGLVAGMRAELNGITSSEYGALSLSWSGSRLLRERLLPRLTSTWTRAALQEAEDERFDRVMERRAELRRTHRWPQADAAQAAEAMRAIASSPDDHARLTPLVFLRGCGFHSSFFVGPLLVLAACWAAVRALRRGAVPAIAFLAPVLMLILLNALFTHGIPRYTLIAIPVFWCAVAWLLCGPRAAGSGS